MFKLILFYIGLFLLEAGVALAQLKWDRTEVDCAAKLTYREVKVDYPFSNTGSAPVEIKSIKGSCACTTGSSDRKTYPSGAKGVIHVVFAVGNHRGLQSKSVTVETSGAGAGDYRQVLVFKIDLPETARFDVKSLVWPLGGKATPKTATLKIAEGLADRPTRIVSTNPVLSLDYKQARPGVFEVTARPSTTAEAASGFIRVEFDDPNAGTVTLPFHIGK